MIVSLIAAVSKNGVIGTGDGGIPWHLPRDSQHFRSYTAGKWMLLGRRTFLEMDGWFKDQTPVVLTRSGAFEVPGGYRVNSVQEAVELAKDNNAEELVVSGGSQIYQMALPMVDKLVLTEVDAEIAGKVKFPEVDWQCWHLKESEFWKKDQDNIYNMTLKIFVFDKVQ